MLHKLRTQNWYIFRSDSTTQKLQLRPAAAEARKHKTKGIKNSGPASHLQQGA